MTRVVNHKTKNWSVNVSNKDLEQLAAADAKAYLAAEMAIGEGSGNRRKLVYADVNHKDYTIPGYREAFDAVYETLDRSAAVNAALRERKHLDRAAKATKNIKAIRRGDLNGLSTGVFIGVGIAIVAHQTGYDKKAWAKTKELYSKHVKPQVDRFNAGDL